MKKVLLIGWKDVTLAFRDSTALILMLAAPFALTLGLGLVTGRFAGTGSGGVGSIPVVLVDEDGGALGELLVEVFESEELSALVTTAVLDDAERARQLVDDDEVTAAVIVPTGFSEAVLGTAPGGDVPRITVYANPTRPTGVGVVDAIVSEFTHRVEAGRVGVQVTVSQLLDGGLLSPEEAARYGAEVAERQAARLEGGGSISLREMRADGEVASFDVLAYLAPGMALMFLMYTVAHGGRTLLAERAQGTLPRLLVTPTSTSQVLAGKVLGVYLTGVAQVLILVGASTLLFGLDWGDPLGVLVLVLAAVVGAVGWGALITSLARTPGQVASVGSAVMLTFGILGGSFISLDLMPSWLRALSNVTPNAWGLDGFLALSLGGRLVDVLDNVAGLVVMGLVLFAVSAVIAGRRGIAQP